MIEGWLRSRQALPMTGARPVALALHRTLYLAWGSGIAASWLQRYPRMHQLHHAHGTANYSTFTPLIDRSFATHEA